MGERGQIVIPKPYRDRLGLRGGQLMEIREDRGRLIVTKTPDVGATDAYFGILRDEFAEMGFERTDRLHPRDPPRRRAPDYRTYVRSLRVTVPEASP